MRGMEKPATYSGELWAYSRYNPRYIGARKLKRRESRARAMAGLAEVGKAIAVPSEIAALFQLIYLLLQVFHLL